ncbi:MAG: hypothetical protein ACXIVQ_13315 [Acidimicrobiales bacterium]
MTRSEPYEFNRLAAQTRLHIVEELLRALDLGAELVSAIDACADRDDAHRRLEAPPFGFDDQVVDHILDLQLGHRTRLGVRALQNEAAELTDRLGL